MTFKNKNIHKSTGIIVRKEYSRWLILFNRSLRGDCSFFAMDSTVYVRHKCAWPKRKNDYQLDRVIGQGATAMVMAATFTHPETKQPSDCAIKLINLDRRSENMSDIAKVCNVSYVEIG